MITDPKFHKKILFSHETHFCLNVGHNVTVNGKRYRVMIIDLLVSQLKDVDVDNLEFQ